MRIVGFANLSFFEPAIFIFLLHRHENQSKFVGQQGWDSILMITLVTSKFFAMRNNTLYILCKVNDLRFDCMTYILRGPLCRIILLVLLAQFSTSPKEQTLCTIKIHMNVHCKCLQTNDRQTNI